MNRILVASLLLACGSAYAVLEGRPGDSQAAPAQRSAAVTSAGVSYTDVVRTLPTGTVVHEYADASGTVFAVSWSGARKPDLKQLLGTSHFNSLKDGMATQGRRANRSHMDLATGDLVVQSAGHMGAYEGRAWLQSRVPAGFDTQEMR